METEISARGGEHDFDFLFGSWNVHHRRLVDPVAGNEWYEFDSTALVRPLWNGKGNVDEFIGETPSGPFEGGTLRLYDTTTRLWSLYWMTPVRGLITVPNVGAFRDDGIGEFVSHELFDHKQIFCRYRWIQRFGDGCRWEQAFSFDHGATWKLNWTMDFTSRRDWSAQVSGY
jgi:hypothetical protein